MVLICLSLMINDVEHLFIYLLPIVWLLWRNVYSNPLSIFNWVIWFLPLRFLDFSYIFNINPLLDRWYANLFSHSRGCLYILLMIFLAAQKIFIGISFIYLFLHSYHTSNEKLKVCQTHQRL